MDDKKDLIASPVIDKTGHHHIRQRVDVPTSLGPFELCFCGDIFVTKKYSGDLFVIVDGMLLDGDQKNWRDLLVMDPEDGSWVRVTPPVGQDYDIGGITVFALPDVSRYARSLGETLSALEYHSFGIKTRLDDARAARAALLSSLAHAS